MLLDFNASMPHMLWLKICLSVGNNVLYRWKFLRDETFGKLQKIRFSHFYIHKSFAHCFAKVKQRNVELHDYIFIKLSLLAKFTKVSSLENFCLYSM